MARMYECSKHGMTEFEEANANGDCFCKKCIKEAIDKYYEAMAKEGVKVEELPVEFTKYPMTGFSMGCTYEIQDPEKAKEELMKYNMPKSEPLSRMFFRPVEDKKDG